MEQKHGGLVQSILDKVYWIENDGVFQYPPPPGLMCVWHKPNNICDEGHTIICGFTSIFLRDQIVEAKD